MGCGGPAERSRSVGASTRYWASALRPTHISNAVLALRLGNDRARRTINLPVLDDGPPHPELLNFPNGMLRWSDLAFNPQHSPGWHSTVQLAVDWDADADECPYFDKWVATTLPKDCAQFVYEVIGYLMMNGNPWHLAVMLKGTGRNGKGTFLRIVGAIIGRHNYASVTLQQLTGNRFMPAQLHMRLANIAGDIPGTRIEDTSAFKMATGADSMTVENKNQHPFRFTPWAVPIFSANKVPTSADTSVGYLSRWMVLGFPHNLLEEGVIDPRIEEHILADELRAVARRSVEGLRRLMERGHFEWPESVQETYREFEEHVDPVRSWANAHQVDGWSPRTPLYRSFEEWGMENGHASMNSATFYDRLELAGYRQAKHGGVRGFHGLHVPKERGGRSRGRSINR